MPPAGLEKPDEGEINGALHISFPLGFRAGPSSTQDLCMENARLYSRGSMLDPDYVEKFLPLAVRFLVNILDQPSGTYFAGMNHGFRFPTAACALISTSI